MVTLTAVIPATNDPPTLAACLGAILAAERRQKKSSSSPRAAARRRRVTTAWTTRRATSSSSSTRTCFRTPTRSRASARFRGGPTLTAVFGSYDDAPAEPGVVSQFRNLLHHHVHQQGAGEATTFWAGLGAVRADAFRAAGGFDAERYPLPSVEDIDLGTRLSRNGGRILLDPLIQGTHLKAGRS